MSFPCKGRLASFVQRLHRLSAIQRINHYSFDTVDIVIYPMIRAFHRLNDNWGLIYRIDNGGTTSCFLMAVFHNSFLLSRPSISPKKNCILLQLTSRSEIIDPLAVALLWVFTASNHCILTDVRP